MADDRVLPPSGRRLALARRAGLVPRSSILVAGAAWTGAAIGLWLAAARARDALSASIAAAATATGGPLAASVPTTGATPAPLAMPTTTGVVIAVVGIAAPLVVGAALAAIAAHLAQTRSLAIPRRVIPGAPRPTRGFDRRAGDAGLAMIRAAAVAAVAIAWTWVHLEDLGRLTDLPAARVVVAAAALAISALAHLAAALLVAGALDLGVAVLRHRADLRMTRTEAADDARAAGIDPRWRRSRATADIDVSAIRTARVVIAGDGAVAVRYHPRLWPQPSVVAAGRGVDATRIVELARRHRVPIHHAPTLARSLATVVPGSAVPDAVQPALAEVLAAEPTDPG